MSQRILVVGAHVDDESFGCLGTLLKHKASGDKIAFLWFTQARDTIKGAAKVCEYFNSPGEFIDLKDQALDDYALSSLIGPVEQSLEYYKPDVVYCPFIGDLNRDHRIVSEATMVACRPYLPNAPREVWMYEIPGSTEIGLRPFVTDVSVKFDPRKKRGLIENWYPGELINGREDICIEERFERWPKCR